jgi:hypothetical protein
MPPPLAGIGVVYNKEPGAHRSHCNASRVRKLVPISGHAAKNTHRGPIAYGPWS